MKMNQVVESKQNMSLNKYTIIKNKITESSSLRLAFCIILCEKYINIYSIVMKRFCFTESSIRNH